MGTHKLLGGDSVKRSTYAGLRRIKRYFQRLVWSRKVSPQWAEIIKADRVQWNDAREAAKNGPNILIATSTGGNQYATPIESMLAVALTLRGANVHFLLCDKALPACQQSMNIEFWTTSSFANQGPRLLCDQCIQTGSRTYQPLGLPTHLYNNLISPDERKIAVDLSRSISLADVHRFHLDGLSVGEHAMAGALRYFAKGTLSDEPYGESVVRRYLEAALLTVFSFRRLLGLVNFKACCFHHGVYIPQGVIGEVCRQHGVGVINWSPAYRKKTFIFSHSDTYHHTLMFEPTNAWETIKWAPELESGLLSYLRSRWTGKHDWIYFHDKPEENVATISRKLGIDFSKPVIGMLTNVVWDAQLHYPANAFPSMLDWILETIGYFSRRPDLQLLIRVHPAEIRGMLPSRQKVVDEIRKMYPSLPQNIHIIPPESRISTYVAMMQCDSVIIYGTKTGVELSSMGIPVIVAGEAWIRNKGVTIDAHTIEEYFLILDRLPLRQRMDAATTLRARMYAYHFFFRRMIPLTFIRPTPGWWPYQLDIKSVADLLPGRDHGLDVICDGILSGSDFVYPAEQRSLQFA